MNRRLVAVLTALALLVQGFGMASVAVAAGLDRPPADEALATMPCHGDADEGDAADASTPCDCCNSGCMFACGGAPLPATLAAGPAPAPDHPFPAAAIAAPLASHSLTPFRPPAA